MSSRGWFWRVAAWALALASIGSAAAAQAPTAAPLRFSILALRPVAGLAYVPRPGAAAEKVVLNPTARSPRYEYRGSQPLRLTELATGKAVAEATIPAGMQEVLLVLIPVEAATAARTGLSHQVAVMDDSWSRLGAGHLSIVNLSGLALEGTVGSEAVTLQPGLNPARKLGGPTEVVLRAPVKGRAVRAFGGRVELRRNERALLLLFPPLRKGSVEVQSRWLIDTAPAAKPNGPGR